MTESKQISEKNTQQIHDNNFLKENIEILIKGCRMAQEVGGVYELEDARALANAIEWLTKSKGKGLFY